MFPGQNILGACRRLVTKQRPLYTARYALRLQPSFQTHLARRQPCLHRVTTDRLHNVSSVTVGCLHRPITDTAWPRKEATASLTPGDRWSSRAALGLGPPGARGDILTILPAIWRSIKPCPKTWSGGQHHFDPAPKCRPWRPHRVVQECGHGRVHTDC